MDKAVFKQLTKADVRSLNWYDDNIVVLAVDTKDYETDHNYKSFLMYVRDGRVEFLEVEGGLLRKTREAVIRKCDKFWLISNPDEQTGKDLQDKLATREQNSKYVRLRKMGQSVEGSSRDKSGYLPNDYDYNPRYAKLKLAKAKTNANKLIDGLKDFLQNEVCDHVVAKRRGYYVDFDVVAKAIRAFENEAINLSSLSSIAKGDVSNLDDEIGSSLIIQVAEMDVNRALDALKIE